MHNKRKKERVLNAGMDAIDIIKLIRNIFIKKEKYLYLWKKKLLFLS